MHTIVIIDDDQANNTLMAAMLRDYRIITANHAEEGIAKVHEYHPDVILIDMRMPGMPGDEAIQILKNDPEVRHIPIIVVTANLHGEVYQAALAAGCDDYLSKPFRPDELKDLIRRYIE